VHGGDISVNGVPFPSLSPRNVPQATIGRRQAHTIRRYVQRPVISRSSPHCCRTTGSFRTASCLDFSTLPGPFFSVQSPLYADCCISFFNISLLNFITSPVTVSVLVFLLLFALLLQPLFTSFSNSSFSVCVKLFCVLYVLVSLSLSLMELSLIGPLCTSLVLRPW